MEVPEQLRYSEEHEWVLVAVNDRLAANPEVINEDCYGEGWMVKVEMADAAEVDALMSAAEYQEFVAQEKAKP
jgi:glycine cleavage system H protein